MTGKKMFTTPHMLGWKRGPPILSSRFLRQRPFTSPPSATSLQNSKYRPVNMLPIPTPGREGPHIEIEHVAALQSFVPRRLRLVAHLFQQAPGRCELVWSGRRTGKVVDHRAVAVGHGSAVCIASQADRPVRWRRGEERVMFATWMCLSMPTVLVFRSRSVTTRKMREGRGLKSVDQPKFAAVCEPCPVFGCSGILSIFSQADDLRLQHRHRRQQEQYAGKTCYPCLAMQEAISNEKLLLEESAVQH